MNLQPIYDDLFNRAEAIAKDGQEHAPIIILFKPTSAGPVLDKIVQPMGLDNREIAALLADVVKEAPQMYVVAHVHEVWMKYVNSKEEADRLEASGVSGEDDKQEAVLFTFFCEGKVWLAACPVDHKGKRLSRGELKEIPRSDIRGRMIPEQRV